MVKIFKKNNIPVTYDDLKTLFFQDFNNSCETGFFIDFSHLIKFSLDYEKNQEFRNFMRKIKNQINLKEKLSEDEYKKL